MREAMREAEAEAQQEKRKKKEKRKSTNTRNTSESWKGPNERKGKRERAWARKIIYKSKASPGVPHPDLPPVWRVESNGQ